MTTRGRAEPACEGRVHPFDFFATLVWLDGRPLMDTIEPYRRHIFQSVLWTFVGDGRPRYDRALLGRAKKNWKTADLVLAGLYRLLASPSPAGNDCFVLANDQEQASDDLTLAKKLVAANPVLAREVTLTARSIDRRDGNGAMTILPAKDVAGAHGKTYLFIGFDEIHEYRNYDLLEALSPDPTRPDVLVWITSYANLVSVPGVPLHDLMEAGRRGDDERMFFSWYSGNYGTDPAFNELATPEERANPSMASWADGGYLAQQKKRLPSNKYRRLHLNLPGAPDGAAFSSEHVVAAIVPNRRSLPRVDGARYVAFVDMSGGSSDDAAVGIAHREAGSRLVLDLVASQSGPPPFNPRNAVAKFAGLLKEYGIRRVVGDAYGGQTFRADFLSHGIIYEVHKWKSASDIYEMFEPRLTAGEIELPDQPKLTEQLLTLVWRGAKITHQVGDHDDWANAACGALLAAAAPGTIAISPEAMRWAKGLPMNAAWASMPRWPY
jgi:hypothetical protein